MSWIGRFLNFFRRRQVEEEIGEELDSPIAEAIDRQRRARDLMEKIAPLPDVIVLQECGRPSDQNEQCVWMGDPNGSKGIDVITRGQWTARIVSHRGTLTRANSGFSVRTIQDQSAFVRWQTLRERLLASLSLFFWIVALVLGAIGLFGVLNYSVTQQRREIGIRMALGAPPAQVVRLITSSLLGMVSLGMFLGLAGGVLCGRFVESLLFEIKPTDPGAIALPVLALLGAAAMASLPPAIRAVKIDPAQTLRSE